MKRRLNIACALVHDPEIILLDEPTAGVDPQSRNAIFDNLEMLKAAGKALIYTTHYMEEAERLADQDPLAPVANRRAFMRELGRVVAFARRHQLPASLVYLDINGFKQINESLGHAGGDAALRHVAALLLANVRESDVVGRLGGDEFGVILSGTGLAAAVEKADQLRQLICAQNFAWQGRAVSLGIAAGVADLLAEETPEQAINAADHAMFVDKRRQRGATEQETPKS